MGRLQDVRGFLKKVIDDHQQSFDKDNIRDFIDAYLLEISKTDQNDTGSSFHPDNGIYQLMGTLVDLFAAGSETTSSSLTWAILFMVRNLDIQTKVREEILRLIGSNRVPSLKDRIDLPYTEATIMEVQRLANIVPKAVPHGTLNKSATVGKFTIPKNHYVLASLTHVLHSEDYWERSETFNQFLLTLIDF